jgi:hypothetical protein
VATGIAILGQWIKSLTARFCHMVIASVAISQETERSFAIISGSKVNLGSAASPFRPGKLDSTNAAGLRKNIVRATGFASGKEPLTTCREPFEAQIALRSSAEGKHQDS